MEELRDGNNLGDHLKSLVSELIFLVKQKRRKLGMLSVMVPKYIFSIATFYQISLLKKILFSLSQ